MEHFQLTLPEIAELTDRQIASIYEHPRGKDGTLVVPHSAGGRPQGAAFETYEDDLAFIETLHSAYKLDNYDQLKRDLEAKWHRNGHDGGDQGAN